MSTVGSIDVQIRADISNLQQNLRTMQSRLQSATSNVATQTNSIANSFKNMSKMIGTSIATYVVFKGLDLMTNGLMNTIKVYNQFESASMGLKSILDAQGKSFSDAQAFIKSYVSDGLIPMSDAVTAFKTLSAAGYNVEETEKVMLRLKDASAFGRQASLTMGEAVRSASEGIKNENSILLDNSGITKNLSLMWADYAKSISKGVNSLSRQEKIQAVVNGIMEESKFQVGDAAKYSATLGGGLAALSSQFTMLKGAIGAVFAPALAAVMPFVTEAIAKFTIFANTMASLSKFLFGTSAAQKTTTKTTTTGAKAAADMSKGEDKVKKSVKDAGKAIKDNLQSFDELNTIQKETAEAAEASADASNTKDNTSTTTLEVTVDPMVEAAVNNFKAMLEQLKIDFKPTIEAIGELELALKPLKDFVFTNIENFYTNALKPIGDWVVGEGLPKFIKITAKMLEDVDYVKITTYLNEFYKSIEPFAKAVGEGLLWFYEKILVPIGTYAINELLPPFLDILTTLIKGLTAGIKDGKKHFEWFYDKWLLPLATWTGGIVAIALKGIASALKKVSDWITENDELVDAMTKIVVGFFAAWKVIDIISFIELTGGIVGAFGRIKAAIWACTGAIAISNLETMYLKVLYAGDFIKSIFAVTKAFWLSTSALVVNRLETLYLQLLYAGDFIRSVWAVTKAHWLFNAAMVAMPWVLAIAGIAALVTAFIYLMETNAKFRKGIADSMGGLSIFVNTIYNGAIIAFNDFRIAVIDMAADGTTALLDNFINPVIKGLNKVISLSNELAGTNFDSVKEIKFNSIAYLNERQDYMNQNREAITRADQMLSKANAISAEVDNYFATLGKDPKSIGATINNLASKLTKDTETVKSGIQTNVGTPDSVSDSTAKTKKDNALSQAQTLANQYKNSLADQLSIGNISSDQFKKDKARLDAIVNLSQANIPKLSSGGIASSATMAVIGEGKYSEVVQPLGGPKYDALIEGVANAVISAMSITSQNNKQSGDITLQVDGKTIAKVLNPYIESEQKRSNTRLVLST